MKTGARKATLKLQACRQQVLNFQGRFLNFYLLI